MRIVILIFFFFGINNIYCQVKGDSLRSDIVNDSIVKRKPPEFKKLDIVGNYATFKYNSGKTKFLFGIIKKKKSVILHGEYFYYYENGTIKEEGSYYNDNKFGIWLYYDEKGNQVKKKFFK